MRNGRGGGVGFTLTDDRREFAGPPKPPFLLLRSRLDSPLLINGALLRHDAPFMFIGCSAVIELFGYTFTDRSEKAASPLPPLRTDHRPLLTPLLLICPELPLERSVFVEEPEKEFVCGCVGAVCLCVRALRRSAGTFTQVTHRGGFTQHHCCCSQPLHGTGGSEQNPKGWARAHGVSTVNQ